MISPKQEARVEAFGQQNYRNFILECRRCIWVNVLKEVCSNISVADCLNAEKTEYMPSTGDKPQSDWKVLLHSTYDPSGPPTTTTWNIACEASTENDYAV
jgi:hypothetical protein